MAHDELLKASAKDFWEGGYRPDENRAALKDLHGVAPSDKTLHRWASDGKWEHWKVARRAGLAVAGNPNVPFGVTGIQDPIFHLCDVLARREVRADSGTRSNDPRSSITRRVLETVQWTYQPGPVALQRLKPRIMAYITAFRNNPPSPDDGLIIDPDIQAVIDVIEEDE